MKTQHWGKAGVVLALMSVLLLSGCSVLPGDPAQTPFGFQRGKAGDLIMYVPACKLPGYGAIDASKIERVTVAEVSPNGDPGRSLWDASGYLQVNDKTRKVFIGSQKAWSKVSIHVPVQQWPSTLDISVMYKGDSGYSPAGVNGLRKLPNEGSLTYALYGDASSLATVSELNAKCP